MEFFSVGFIFTDVQKYFSNHFWGDRPRCPLYSLFRIKMQPVRLFWRYPNFQRSAGYMPKYAFLSKPARFVQPFR